MKKLFILLALTALFGNVKAQTDNDRRVIFIMLDGLRWQELFNGADTAYVNNRKYAVNPEGIGKLYVRDTQEERRMALMPFTWGFVRPNISVLEAANRDPRYQGRVMAFASWGTVANILNMHRSGLPVVAGQYSKTTAHTPSEREAFLDGMKADMVDMWGDATLDLITSLATTDAMTIISWPPTTMTISSAVCGNRHKTTLSTVTRPPSS